MTAYDRLRAALPPHDRPEFDAQMHHLGMNAAQADAWERWQRAARAPELVQAAETVAEFLEQRGSMPNTDQRTITGVHSDPDRPMAHLYADHLVRLVLHAGAPRPLPILVTHKGPWKFLYQCAERSYWVERRGPDTAPAVYFIFDIGAGQSAPLDRDTPTGRAPDQPAAKRFVRDHRRALLGDTKTTTPTPDTP